MTPREVDLPPLAGCGINSYAPHAHIQGYDVLHDGRFPYVSRMEHLLAVKRVEAERDAALAEIERLTAEVARLRAVTHFAPDGRTRHPGQYAACTVGICVNDREDDAEYTPPPYRSQIVPQRRDNGQRGVA